MEALETRNLLSAPPAFTPTQVHFLGTPTSAVAADLNGDGALDVATALGGEYVGVALGNGDGTFQAPQRFSVGQLDLSSTNSLAAGDLDRDGNIDLVVVDFGAPNAVSILWNTTTDHTLSFQASDPVIMGSQPTAVALGDLNNDGKLDVVTANIGAPADRSVGVRLGTGLRLVPFGLLQFAAAGANAQSLTLGNINHDGNLDLAVTYASATGPSADQVGVLLGNGDGSFAPATFYLVGTTPSAVAIADLNGDGAADLAVSNYNSNNVTILLNSGAGSFIPTATLRVGRAPTAIVAADFNHDGNLDLAVANSGSNSITLLVGTGKGTFHVRRTFPVAGSPQSRLAVGDFNNDGLTDLAVPTLSPGLIAHGTITVLLNTTKVKT